MTGVARVAICDDAGNRIELGENLGTGGEGSVYAILAAHEAGSEIQVAKLYHQPLTAEKRAKLSSMVSCNSAALRAVAAWPTALLHEGRDGEVVGFLMPRIRGYRAVHTLYGPAQRKASYPSADWGLLLQLARNVAAAF